ncbi:actin-domain-containing protein [Calycina marina]|uniref:Actin-domain-containing protein n=1 Tax=Calycina marina TaxID=1763456 RepID=A0A9P8CC88_9HELO|nr:actin-domain-containing protein [Calycina marina]
MAPASGPSHRNVSNIRPQPTAAQPTSPHTPLRSITSTYGSPSALRAEEDCIVVEIGTRYLRAGFAGDSLPKAVVEFGPEEQRRSGDYRRWCTHYEVQWRDRIPGDGYGKESELWKMDLQGLDLGLVGDKIERAVREAFTKYLLIDSRPRRIALALPSTLPLPLLSTILDSLFTNFQPPNISLVSTPALTTVAAGLRSSLVVDIGWAETIVTAIYELREVQSKRSTRACKLHGEKMYTMLADAINPEWAEYYGEISRSLRQLLSFEECEDITARMSWCKGMRKEKPSVPSEKLAPVKEEDEFRSSMRSLRVTGGAEEGPAVSIPLRSTLPPRTLQMPFSRLAEPCEMALFASDRFEGVMFDEWGEQFDDEELPLPLLVYQSLLQLPMDIRSTCMPRIIFVGGGSKILGLKERVLAEVMVLIEKYGWDPVRGKSVGAFRSNPKLQNRQHQKDSAATEVKPGERDSEPASIGSKAPAAAFVEQESNVIDDQLQHEASRVYKPAVQSGYIRAVESLGAWSGCSLISQLKISAVSVVDREQWLAQGASGATRDMDVGVSMATKRQSMGGTVAFKSGVGERSSWTLGFWA